MAADQETAMFCEELSQKRLELKLYIFPSVLSFALGVMFAAGARGQSTQPRPEQLPQGETGASQTVLASTPDDGSVLPFPSTPSASVAKPRLQDSIHKRRVEERHLPADAPNILIVLVDDVGFLSFVEWPKSVTPIGPTRSKDETAMWVLGRYLGPTVGVPC